MKLHYNFVWQGITFSTEKMSFEEKPFTQEIKTHFDKYFLLVARKNSNF